MYRLLQQQWPDWKWYRRASSAFIPSSSSTNCWSYPSSSMGVKLGHFWSKQEKGSRCLRINAWESSASNTSWDYKTNDYVCSKVKSVMVQYESLLAIIKCWNMSHGITTSARHCWRWTRAGMVMLKLVLWHQWMDMTMMELRASANRSSWKRFCFFCP